MLVGMCRKLLRYLKKKVYRLFHNQNIPFGAILMLHRVDTPNPNGIWYNQHLKMSPTVINEMVEYALSCGCHFVSLDELTDAICSKRNVRKMIAITLDDGYRDNYEIGYPCFKKLNVPFCIYVCTSMVEGKMYYWWEYLEQLVLKYDKIELTNGKTVVCGTKEEKEKAFLNIRENILKLPQESISAIRELFPAEYEFGSTFGKDDLGLTWEQIRELKKEPLATIGNHTYSHKAFTGCSDEEIVADIKAAQVEMHKNASIEMKHFAFPFGEATAVSQHDVELVKGLGFATSATTRSDLVRYGTDVLEFPRLFVTERNWKNVIDLIAENC